VNLLADWRAAVEARTWSPWPGPRPMREGRDESSDLIGRDRDSRELTRLVYDTDVVIFTGASAVGKTSMLQLALVPTLQEAGYTVLLCDNWNGTADAGGVDQLLLRQARKRTDLADLLAYTEDGVPLMDALDELYPDRSVIVLDQFEELIRYQRVEYQKVLRWIEAAAARTRVRIVVSLRVEYVHELRGYGGLNVGPFQQVNYELKPITDGELIKEIIESGVGDSNALAPTIAAEAVSALLQEWDATKGEASSGRSLLHLQALLFVLWRQKSGDRIETIDLERLRGGVLSRRRSARGRADDADAKSGLLVHALPLAVQVSLDACNAACRPEAKQGWVGVDPVLAHRARDLVRSLSAHLSSGGYKVDQQREELTLRAILGEGTSRLAHYIAAVERARRTLAAMVDASNPPSRPVPDAPPVPDWLCASRAELFEEPPPPMAPWDRLDEGEVTGGPLLDLRPEDSLLEEYRAAYFALEWLRACELVRVSTAQDGKSMVTLVHDLFGDGLIEWSEATHDASAPVYQFTALHGVEIAGAAPASRATLSHPVLVNLRWRSCEVSAELNQVTFVNCDFRGTTFVDCVFEGVSFVNCMLDDAEFLRCTIVKACGPLPPAPEEPERPSLPSYFVADVPPMLLRSLQWYREPRRIATDGGLGIYSPTAGLAAYVAPRSLVKGAREFAAETGGLSMFGGRVSSLKVRECMFGRDGRMALRYVAGTSVEFADQEGARLDVEGAALRGLTFTRPVRNVNPIYGGKPVGAGTGSGGPPFELRFSNSLIINVWFGVGLTGKAIFDGCQGWQIFNAADRADFQVSMPNAKAYGVVNVEPLQPWQSIGFDAVSLGNQREAVWSASGVIDYRRRPLRSELLTLPQSSTEED
jgi:Pentapeptide repeats (9 copies)